MKAEAPYNVLADSYNVWVPIEDTDLMKSVEVDANGDWLVSGVMSSDDNDEENDSITPDGMDCSYFLTKGWVKYEHGNNPNQFIGEPVEVRVGRFDHPTLRKSVNGVYVKARLFQHRELAKQAVNAIQDLQKSATKRTMGWSIEGNVKERCRTTGKIIKSVLRNVVLTMNPVNTMTWAELSKSFAQNHEVEVDMEKAMDTAAMAEVTPQSVEGNTHDDAQEKWIHLFRKFVKNNALQKGLRQEFLSSNPGELGMQAYLHAKREGLDYDGACEFGTFVSSRCDTLKSLIGKFGGEQMSKQAQASVAELLDTDLEELQKSLEMDDEELEEEELVKSQNGDGGDDGDEEDEDNGDDGNEDDEEDEEIEKSLKTDFAKSLAKEPGTAQAFDVSDFLASIADEIGFSMDGFNKSLSHVTKQQAATVQVLTSVGELMKSLSNELKEVKADNAELQKSLSEVLQRPVGRKSVVNQREVQTITKSMGGANGNDGGEKPLTRGRVLEVLNKSFDAGNMKLGSEIMRFEAGVSVDKLNLPESVKTELGLQ